MMVKSDMPNIRLEIHDEGVRYIVDKKLDRKKIKIALGASLPNMPSLIGFTITPIFRK